MFHYIDIAVGQMMRRRRTELHMSQADLGYQMFGVSFQQVQKYESGKNRVSASSLWAAAKALKVSIDYFFKPLRNLPDDPAATARLERQLKVLESMPELEALADASPKALKVVRDVIVSVTT